MFTNIQNKNEAPHSKYILCKYPCKPRSSRRNAEQDILLFLKYYVSQTFGKAPKLLSYHQILLLCSYKTQHCLKAKDFQGQRELKSTSIAGADLFNEMYHIQCARPAH